MSREPDATKYGLLTLAGEHIEAARRDTKRRPDCVEGSVQAAMRLLEAVGDGGPKRWWRVKRRKGETEPFSVEEMSEALARSDHERVRWDADHLVCTHIVRAGSVAEAARGFIPRASEA